jgi:hypothetical protein
MKELEAAMELSIGFKKFLKSDPGKYLIGVAEQDTKIAKDQLLEIDPYKYTTLADLQNAILSIQREANVAMALQNYIGVAIVEGEQAEQHLNTEGAD